MDERSFDKFIKDKLDQYEDPEFDTATWVDLRSRLSTLTRTSWFAQNGSKMVVASVLFFTLINGYIVWLGLPSYQDKTKTDIALHRQNARMDSLMKVISELHNSLKNATLAFNPNTDFQDQSVLTQHRFKSKYRKSILDVYKKDLLLGNSDIDNEILNRLVQENVVEIEDGHVILVPRNKRESSHDGLNIFTKKLSPIDLLESYRKPKIPVHSIVIKSSSNHVEHIVSAKVKNALEKHYFRGSGINIAPHADLTTGFFDNVHGTLTPRIGISTDWIIGPRISIETSFDYSMLRYVLQDSYEKLSLPTYNSDWGNPTSIAVTTKLFSLPVSIKYRQWLTNKNQVFLKAGYTPYISISRQCEMNYLINIHHGYDQDDNRTISQIEKTNDRHFFGGTISLTVGITRSLNTSSKAELGLFYEKSLGTVGVEKSNLQLVGLRTAYWFKIK